MIRPGTAEPRAAENIKPVAPRGTPWSKAFRPGLRVTLADSRGDERTALVQWADDREASFTVIE